MKDHAYAISTLALVAPSGPDNSRQQVLRSLLKCRLPKG
jgi:hypothetical protein